MRALCTLANAAQRAFNAAAFSTDNPMLIPSGLGGSIAGYRENWGGVEPAGAMAAWAMVRSVEW